MHNGVFGRRARERRDRGEKERSTTRTRMDETCRESMVLTRRHGIVGRRTAEDLPLAPASLQIFSTGTSRLRVLCWHGAAVHGRPASYPRCPEGTASRTTSSFLAPQPCRPPNGWVLGSMALSKLRIFLINNTENNTFISKAPYAEYHSDSEYHLVLIKTKSIHILSLPKKVT